VPKTAGEESADRGYSPNIYVYPIYICISGEKRVRGRVGIYPPLGAMISRLSLDEKLSR